MPHNWVQIYSLFFFFTFNSFNLPTKKGTINPQHLNKKKRQNIENFTKNSLLAILVTFFKSGVRIWSLTDRRTNKGRKFLCLLLDWNDTECPENSQ